MNFPHDTAIETSGAPIALRELDHDILRVLAFAPVIARAPRRHSTARPEGLLALFAGTGKADDVARGSFNPHFAVALNRLAAAEQQGETGVYHSASVNRKAARLLRSHAPHSTSQAF